MGNAGLLKGPNYNTVLQLDRFYRKQGKWVEVPYVFLFISLYYNKAPTGTHVQLFM